MKKNYIIALLLILVAVACRILQPIHNFAPIVAIALFSGYVFKQRNIAITITLIASLLGDILISYINKYPFFHSTIAFVYVSYLMIALMGNYIKSSNNQIQSIAFWGISSSVLFFVITNLGVWLVDGMYDMSLSGLINCFVAAIPFYKYSFLSDLIYIPIIFGIYVFSYQKNKQVALNTTK